MFKVICDICGEDCGRIAHFAEIELISNYATNPRDVNGTTTGNICAKMKLALCSECYDKLNLPNIYEFGESYENISSL